MDVKIEPSWKIRLAEEFEKPYFSQLASFVKEEYHSQKIYPPGKLIFNAFDKCPFEQTKVVILGQDPYHGENQAMGLSFSVNDGVAHPPSLMNIFKVLKFLLTSEHSHFISVDKKYYKRWKWLIILTVKLNKNYKSVEIYRKKFKVLEDFVVVGLKYNGKNVRRRTCGFAKEFVEQNLDARCIYCDEKLTSDNATADHIIPISEGEIGRAHV